eukprot:SAG31_NODE_272_length_18690_cov_14.520785_6_plen_59_part_00
MQLNLNLAATSSRPHDATKFTMPYRLVLVRTGVDLVREYSCTGNVQQRPVKPFTAYLL